MADIPAKVEARATITEARILLLLGNLSFQLQLDSLVLLLSNLINCRQLVLPLSLLQSD